MENGDGTVTAPMLGGVAVAVLEGVKFLIVAT